MDVSGQLPGKVDRVEEAEVERRTGSGEQVGRIAGQQDPPVAVPSGLPGLKLPARQPGRSRQREIRAEHPADAVLELGQSHRRVIVDFAGFFLGGMDEQPALSNPPEGEHPVPGAGEARTEPAQPGYVEVAVVEHGHRVGQRDLAQPVDLRIRGARERDARQVAHRAAAAVAAHQIPRGQPVRPVRPMHVRGHRGVALAQPGHLVSALDDGAEFAGAFAEQALEFRLRERHRLQRGIGQA